jgi:hypothetical protein
MAAPYIGESEPSYSSLQEDPHSQALIAAGASALVLSARKSEKLTPAQVRSLLATTAKYTTSSLASGSSLETTVLQGGGTFRFASPLP